MVGLSIDVWEIIFKVREESMVVGDKEEGKNWGNKIFVRGDGERNEDKESYKEILLLERFK